MDLIALIGVAVAIVGFLGLINVLVHFTVAVALVVIIIGVIIAVYFGSSGYRGRTRL